MSVTCGRAESDFYLIRLDFEVKGGWLMEVLTQWQSWIKASETPASICFTAHLSCHSVFSSTAPSAYLSHTSADSIPLSVSPTPHPPHPSSPPRPRQPRSHSHSLDLMTGSDGSNFRPLYHLPHSSFSFPPTISHFFLFVLSLLPHNPGDRAHGRLVIYLLMYFPSDRSTSPFLPFGFSHSHVPRCFLCRFLLPLPSPGVLSNGVKRDTSSKGDAMNLKWWIFRESTAGGY